MANSTIPGLAAVTVPALTDLFGVRQSGDTRDKKLTAAQLQSLIVSVTKDGTPSVDQVGVWTGDGTLEGLSTFTFNSATGVMAIVGTDIRVTGNLRLLTGSGQAPVLLDVLADETTPTICPAFADQNTGIGWKSADRLALIAGGKRAMVLAESNGIGVIPAYDTGTGLTAFATGGQGSAVVLDRGYNVVTTVATTGDSVKLPTGLAFLVGTVVYLKNNGANSLDLFPGVGDDLGAGLNTAISVAAGAAVAFLGTVEGSTWTQLIFAAGGGGGDVTKVGTPVDNQIGVWTGDGTIEGDVALTFDTASNLLSVENINVDDILIGSGASTGILFAMGGAPIIANLAATSVVPTIIPNKGDTNSGLGLNTFDELSIIAGGVEIARAKEAVGAKQLILVPVGVDNNAALPTLAFGDGDTGFFETIDDTLALSLLGAQKWSWTGDSFISALSDGAGLLNEAVSGTNPTLLPRRNDPDTGIGSFAANVCSVVAGGAEAFRATFAGGGRAILAVANGTLASGIPPYTVQSDLNTGIYFPTLDRMTFHAGGIDIASCIESTNDQFAVINGIVAAPGLAFLSDLDTGLAVATADQLSLVAGGIEGLRITEAASAITGQFVGVLQGSNAAGPLLTDVAAGINTPTIIPDRADLDTGIGTNGGDTLSLICGGKDILQLKTALNQDQVLAGESGTALLPFYSWFGDEDTGFYRVSANILGVSIGGIAQWVFSSDEFRGNETRGPQMISVAAAATTPVFTFQSDNDTGIGSNALDEVSIVAGGVEGFRVAESVAVITNTFMGDLVASGGGGAGPALLNTSASASVPTVIPNQADPDTGLTRDSINGLSMVGGGLGCIRARNIGGARAVGFYTTTPIIQQTGVAVTAGAIHAALVALGLITA